MFPDDHQLHDHRLCLVINDRPVVTLQQESDGDCPQKALGNKTNTF